MTNDESETGGIATPDRKIRTDDLTGADGRAGGSPLRRLYHWVLGWSDRPGGPAALFGISAAESFIFPLPPDILLIPLALGQPRKAFRFALLCTAGSVFGGMIGYLIGSALFQSVGRPLLELYGFEDAYRELGERYARHIVLTLGTAGFTFIPYKLFTIAAGGFGISFPLFVMISAVSRGARFFLVAGLIRHFGHQIRPFIERYFNLLTLLLALLLVAGVLILSFWAQ